MDSILFLLMFVCLALVVGWYVGNEIRGGAGEWGPLAVRGPDESAADASQYRPRAGARFIRRDASPTGGAAIERSAKFQEKSAQSFRDHDEARYRSRGALPRFGDKPTRPTPGEADRS